MAGARYCIPLEELSLDDVPRVGGKTASLGELMRALGSAGVRVPPGFAVTADAYTASLEVAQTADKLRAVLSELDPENAAELARRGHEARQLVTGAGLPHAVAEQIRDAYRELAKRVGETDPAVAVRSSATAEDLPQASFAGQQATHLNVRGEAALLRACIDCFASLFTDRAIFYRAHHGFDHLAVRGAIAVQLMVRADRGSAGVVFTLDPDSGFTEVVVVTGAWGLGESVVAGRVDPDEVLVFKPTLGRVAEPILQRRIGAKQVRTVYAHRGAQSTRTIRVAKADRQRRCFTDQDAIELARWAVAIERHYSERAGRPTPMDIEWAKDGTTGDLWIVQARPETVHARRDRGQLIQFQLDRAPPPILRGTAVGSAIGSGAARVVEDVGDLSSFGEGEVLVADMTDPDWVPALRKAAAVVTNRGGRTCHAAIVSRELGVPCVVGTGTATRVVKPGAEVTVSCARGTGEVFAGAVPWRREVVKVDTLPRTRTKVMLILADPDTAFEHARLPVAGVGLVRQEFVIARHIGIHPLATMHPEEIGRAERRRIEALTRGWPHPASFYVDRLAEGVGMIAAAFWPRDVILRLSDFKSNEYRALVGGSAFEPEEENPTIGLRGASRYLHPRFAPAFELECRAIRRVREQMGLRNLALMVPFCRTPEEGRAVVEVLAAQGLRRGHEGLAVWVMCEIPSNVAVIDRFAQVFDGFSIGSNDLTQLVLGVDRDSEQLAPSFRESDEAVLRTIAAAIRGAHACGRPIGLCGQAPSDDPEFARFLVAEGIDSIALTPDATLRGIEVIANAERASERRGKVA